MKYFYVVLALGMGGCAGLSRGASDVVSGTVASVNPFTDTANWLGYALATTVGAGVVATVRGYVRGKLSDKLGSDSEEPKI